MIKNGCYCRYATPGSDQLNGRTLAQGEWDRRNNWLLAGMRIAVIGKPERHVLAATRSAVSRTVPVQAMIAALQTEAGPGSGAR